MYIVTFTVHRQINMVRTPHFFWTGDATYCVSRGRNHRMQHLGVASRRLILSALVNKHVDLVSYSIRCLTGSQ